MPRLPLINYPDDPSKIHKDSYTPPDWSNMPDEAVQDFNKKPTFWQNLWKNRSAVGQGLLFGADALISYQNEVTQDTNREDQMRNTFQQKPIWDYNYMYGDNQPVIKAPDGAEIRTDGSDAMPVEIEGGEFLILPDGNLEIAKGPKHSRGGIDTMLPNKTKVFSNKLKPKGSKFTFAQLAKKNDYTHHKKALENPFTSAYAKTGAQRMLQRKQEALFDLFDEQQIMNSNSSGKVTGLSSGGNWIQGAINKSHKGWCTPLSNPHCTGARRRLALTFKKHHGFHENGGYIQDEYAIGGETCLDCGGNINYAKGGIYHVSEKEAARLEKLGYKIEVLK